MRKPAALRPGGLIGVVAPAGAVEPDAIMTGAAVLEQCGYRVKLGKSVLKRAGYLAGSDSERLDDLLEMFRDDEVDAVVAARGGYGAGRLLPRLDARVIRDHPKIFIGYSDITFLLTHFVQRGEVVAFHGPMLASLAQDTAAAEAMLSLLSGTRGAWNLSAREVIQPGTNQGIITGGCLSVIVATLGTPYEVDTDDRLLFLEDVNEKPYRIDRMLTQLRQAGKLERVAGVIFGDMAGCIASPNEVVTVRDVIREAFTGAPYPVAFGLPTGHGEVCITLPLGVRARLAGERLTLLEAPFRS